MTVLWSATVEVLLEIRSTAYEGQADSYSDSAGGARYGRFRVSFFDAILDE